MRPLSDLDDDTLRTVAGFACDLDDTLTRRGILATESLRALHAIARADTPCVIATGRPLGWAEVLAGLLPVRGVVAENGAVWAVPGTHGVTVHYRDDESTRAHALARCASVANEVLASAPGFARVPENTVRATDVVLDLAGVPRERIAEALALITARGLHGVASTIHLHVAARAPDKVAGLRALLRTLGLDASTLDSHWVYVGDSPNDAAPFGALRLSVGVANVLDFTTGTAPALTALPAFVTDGSHGAGFAEVVARWERARA